MSSGVTRRAICLGCKGWFYSMSPEISIRGCIRSWLSINPVGSYSQLSSTDEISSAPCLKRLKIVGLVLIVKGSRFTFALEVQVSSQNENALAAKAGATIVATIFYRQELSHTSSLRLFFHNQKIFFWILWEISFEVFWLSKINCIVTSYLQEVHSLQAAIKQLFFWLFHPAISNFRVTHRSVSLNLQK